MVSDGDHIKIYSDIVQGSEEWHAVRCGILTASEMKLIITPNLKIADNDKSRSHMFELLAQRITNYVEPSYISDDMLRGMEDEITACQIYDEKFARIEQVGFVVNDKWGFKIGCSPDGLVGSDGMIEIKSRRQKFQIDTIIDGVIPQDYYIQVQTALLVTQRSWCDFVSYCGGLPMIVIRVYPNHEVQEAIVNAAKAFEAKLAWKLADYTKELEINKRLVPTERRVEQEMHI